MPFTSQLWTRVEAGDVLSRLISSEEEVIFSTERGHSERTLGPIVVERDTRVFEKSLQRSPLTERVLVTDRAET